jgi:hypothetical protein
VIGFVHYVLAAFLHGFAGKNSNASDNDPGWHAFGM